MKRRTLLKSSLAAGLVASTGIVIPGRVLAAYPKAAFENKDSSGALSDIYGMSDFAESGDIKIKAPEIAENGAVVPVQVTSSIAGTESISIVVAGNPTPLLASFNLHGSEGYVSTRIKMGKTSDVLAVVKAGGSLHAARQEVKVTIGGCGG
ncbi:MAG: thiosulfate oxidation carrier protein SoxY [Gammaproteobacteria bacterium]|nr:thiosulfate oxidation carrier protein SoxY [Gammaproteobacteria bacterium]